MRKTILKTNAEKKQNFFKTETFQGRVMPWYITSNMSADWDIALNVSAHWDITFNVWAHWDIIFNVWAHCFKCVCLYLDMTSGDKNMRAENT
jgi:hypothetical protein